MSGEEFADLHHHILWGVDDGPQTAEQMHEMLERAAEDGISLIAATSHAYPKVRAFDCETYFSRLNEANEYCRKKGLNLTVISGSEIHYSDRVPDLLLAGKLPTLNHTRYVLIEFSHETPWTQMDSASEGIYRVGHTPIAAHVERYQTMVRSPKDAMQAREEMGFVYQMNCETILRPRGFFQRRFVHAMLKNQAIDLVATDAHNVTTRAVCMRETYKKLCRDYGEDYACRLTHFGDAVVKQNSGADS